MDHVVNDRLNYVGEVVWLSCLKEFIDMLFKIGIETFYDITTYI